MNGRAEREHLLFSDDNHLVEVTKIPFRLNGWAVLGALMCTASAALVVTAFIYAYIWARHWYQ